jgi:hypothetical protein
MTQSPLSSREKGTTSPAPRGPSRAVVGAAALTVLCCLGLGSLLVRHARSRSSRHALPIPLEPDERSAGVAVRGNPAHTSADGTLNLPSPPATEAPQVLSNVMLENYKTYAMYPPTSRPVTQRRADAFKYNRRQLQYTPVRGDADGGIAFYSVFTANKFNVLPGESITITLKANAAPDPDGRGYPIHILRSGLGLGRAADGATVAALDLRDDGGGGDAAGGDLTYTATVRPADMSELANHHGSVRAFVEFSANGATYGHQLFFNIYPDGAVAARLTGNFREAVEEGSLVVYAELEVFKAGYFDLDATLASSDGTAFCHSRFKGPLNEGTREARLLFFGKVIRDAKPAAQSPFRITELYGQMVPAPDRIAEATKAGDFAPSAVPPLDKVYVTQAYDVQSFSDAEWESADKQNRLGMYNGSAAQ